MMIIGILLAALVIFLLSADASWTNVLSSVRNDLVFDGRNKDYGAYRLRKEEPRNMFFALFIGCGLISGGAGAMVFFQQGSVSLPSVPQVMVDWVLPPLDEEEERPMEEDARPKEDQPREQQSAGGSNDTEPEVSTDPDAGTMQSDDRKAEDPGVGDGDGELTGPVEVPGKGGGGASQQPAGKGWEEIAQVMPCFPGGDRALLAFIYGIIEYPELERERGVEGTVWITFVVDKTGAVTMVEVERGVRGGAGLEREALEAVKMMPRWIPGRNGDTNVAVRQRIPVKFTLMK